MFANSFVNAAGRAVRTRIEAPAPQRTANLTSEASFVGPASHPSRVL